jgi:cell division topological specificity factor
MSLLEFLQRLIGRQAPSATLAKQRLQLVLAHDRSDLNPELLEQMRREILEVVQRYVEVDLEEVDVSLETEDRVTALVANLPIRSARPVRRPEVALASPPAAQEQGTSEPTPPAPAGEAPAEAAEASPTVEALQRAAASLPPSEHDGEAIAGGGGPAATGQPWS